MAQINTCLKCIVTVFNIFFAIVGGLIIGLTLLAQVMVSAQGAEQMREHAVGFIALYVMGGLTMVIAILGAYGAQKENRVCLIVFLVCMVIGSLIMLRIGISASIARPEVENMVRKSFHEALPLNQASSDVKHLVNTMETEFHCCGLFSYEDWDGDIPDSCLCRETEEADCRVVTYEVVMQRSIYSKPCFPIFFYYIQLGYGIALGVIFTLAVLAILGTTLSSIMIHQMRYRQRPATVLTVPTIFTTAPPKYQELQNAPLY